MNGSFQYRGYRGSAGYSAEDEVFHGKLEGIQDLITYESTSVKSLEEAFRDSVDVYLATCAAKGKHLQLPC